MRKLTTPGHPLNSHPLIREIRCNDEAGSEILLIEIEEEPPLFPGHESQGWLVRVAINKGTSIGIHRRYVRNYGQRKINMIGVLKAVFDLLESEDFFLEDEGEGTACAPRSRTSSTAAHFLGRALFRRLSR